MIINTHPPELWNTQMDLNSFLDPKMQQKIALLPPQALKYLLKQISDMPDDQPERHKMQRIAEIAMAALNKQAGTTKKPEQRDYSLKRYFYLPFNKLLFDGELDRRQSGRISRNSMEKIWNYIENKLMPTEVEELELAFKVAIQAKEMKKARIIINEFNRLAGQKLEEVITKCRSNDREWSHFAAAEASSMR